MHLFRFSLLLICTCICVRANAWSIRQNILFIHKNDSISAISDSLSKLGSPYDLLWKECLDSVMSSPLVVVQPGKQISLDSLLRIRYGRAVFAPVLVKENKNSEESHLWDMITAIVTLLGVIMAALLADFYFNKNERRKISFDLFSEFNSSEMHSHRVKADQVIARNLELEIQLSEATEETKAQHQSYFDSFDQMDAKPIEDKRSVYIVLNFYKKVELLRKSRRVELALVPILFGEIFYYWWEYCFDKYNQKSEWEAMALVTSLHHWLETDKKYITDKQRRSWRLANQFSYPRHCNDKATGSGNGKIPVNIEGEVRQIIHEILLERNLI